MLPPDDTLGKNTGNDYGAKSKQLRKKMKMMMKNQKKITANFVNGPCPKNSLGVPYSYTSTKVECLGPKPTQNCQAFLECN